MAECYFSLVIRSFRAAITVLYVSSVRWRGLTFGYLICWLVLVILLIWETMSWYGHCCNGL